MGCRSSTTPRSSGPPRPQAGWGQAAAWLPLALALCLTAWPLAPFSWHGDIRAGQRLALEYGLLWLAAGAFQDRPVRWLLRFPILHLLLTDGAPWVWSGLRHLLLTMLVFTLGASWLRGKVERAILVVRWLALAQLAFLLLQHFNLHPWFADDPQGRWSDAMTGLLENRSLAAGWAAVTLPLCLTKRWWPVAAGLSAAIVLGHPTGALSVLALVGLVYAIRRLRWCGMGLAVVACASVLIIYQPQVRVADARRGGMPRLESYRMAVEHVTQRPAYTWIGRGLGSYEIVATRNRPKNPDGSQLPWRHVHNDPLEAFFEWGLVGMALWAWFYGRLFAGWWRRARVDPTLGRLGLSGLAWLAVSCYLFPSFVGPTLGLGVFLMTALNARLKEAAC